MIQALQNQLDQIHGSRGYKFLQEYYSVHDKLLPKGSMRRLDFKKYQRRFSKRKNY